MHVTEAKGGVKVDRRILYQINVTPFGLLLTAYTDRGVCAVSLGDDETMLLTEVKKDLKCHSIKKDTDGIGEWPRLIAGYLGGDAPLPNLPLDLMTTAFGEEVYRALKAIPMGETRSYEAVAEAIGRPRAVRAVASACARNRVSILIPCHRVIRKDGSLGGYRWGLERKKALLAWEKGRCSRRT